MCLKEKNMKKHRIVEQRKSRVIIIVLLAIVLAFMIVSLILLHKGREEKKDNYTSLIDKENYSEDNSLDNSINDDSNLGSVVPASINWDFDENTGKLNIYGNGRMKFYDSENDEVIPWNGIKNDIVVVDIAQGITDISDRAFYGCESLTSISIPDSVISIGNSAFSRCISLPSILIPSGVTSIGKEAFSYCTSLTRVSLPDHLTNTIEDVFLETPWLEKRLEDQENASSINDITSETRPDKKLYPRPNETLQYSSQGENVKYVQAMLITMNYDDVTVNGQFDSKTEDAVKRWQKNHGLEQNGIVDEKILCAMEEAETAWIEKHSSNQKKTDIDNTNEAQLRLIAEGLGTVGLWAYADYDGNGSEEAYTVIVEIDSDGNKIAKAIYYIDSSGSYKEMGTTFGYSYNDENDCFCTYQGKGFFYGDFGTYGSGFHTILYSVKNGTPYALDISDELQGFYQSGNILYTTENDFSTGSHTRPVIELVYVAETQQFIKGSRLADDIFDWNP